MKVYRLAHPDTPDWEGVPTGPYRKNWALSEEAREILDQMNDDHGDGFHPVPWRDGLDDPEEDEYCAFTSLQELFEWFDGWEEDLFLMGFEIFEYEVPASHVKFGRIQILVRLDRDTPHVRKCILDEMPV